MESHFAAFVLGKQLKRESKRGFWVCRGVFTDELKRIQFEFRVVSQSQHRVCWGEATMNPVFTMGWMFAEWALAQWLALARRSARLRRRHR